MVEAKKQPSSSRWWWFERLSAADGNQKRSPWLQLTLAELDEKTRSMLKLIEEDADSFAQRAEMYYKKRPQLISLVEDFYRTHRSLAERYDLQRPDSGKPGLVTFPWESPSSVTKCSKQKFTNSNSSKKSYDSCSETHESPLSVAKCGKQEKEKSYDSCSETCESPLSVAKCGKQEKEKSYDSYSETYGLPLSVAKCGKLQEKERAYDSYSETYESEEESDVEDPEPEHEPEPEPEPKQQKDDVMKLMQEEMERLKEENKAQKEEMIRKDEEKRDVIRQLSLAMDLLREENQVLRKRVMVPKKQNHQFAESNKMDAFWKRLFFNKSSA